MFIRRINKKQGQKTYTTTYLAESYRDINGKVQHKYISNISKLPDNVILGLQKILQGEKISSIARLPSASQPYIRFLFVETSSLLMATFRFAVARNTLANH